MQKHGEGAGTVISSLRGIGRGCATGSFQYQGRCDVGSGSVCGECSELAQGPLLRGELFAKCTV